MTKSISTATVPPRPIDGLVCVVTGGGGYLGAHIIEALLGRGCHVRVLDTVAPPVAARDGVTWCRGDITRPEDVRAALEGAQVVFHTAALIELAHHAPRAVIDRVLGVNVKGTEVLLEEAARAGVERFVHTSSTNVVLGKHTSGGDETGPYTDSPDLYSSTKAEAEKRVLAANGHGGMLTCAIRPGGIYGPGERKTIVGPTVEGLKQGAPVIIFGPGTSRIDYTYVDNLVDGQLRAADRLYEGSRVAGQAYFVTDDQPINPGEFSIRLVRSMGMSTPALRLRKSTVRLIATAWERAYQRFGRPHPQITLTGLRLCTENSYFRIDKARRDLGYAPLVSTDEGLSRTAVDAAAYFDSL